jgi:DMSO/TMAO reductase YedYZ molybdopterin-dependent catalytic subunit
MAMIPGGPPPRGRPEDVDLPPGQYWVREFPALSAGPPPAVTKADWEFTLTAEDGRIRRWDWAAFRALPSQRISVDLHCVTGWSVPVSRWEATSVHHMLRGVGTSAQYVVVHSYAGHTTNSSATPSTCRPTRCAAFPATPPT